MWHGVRKDKLIIQKRFCPGVGGVSFFSIIYMRLRGNCGEGEEKYSLFFHKRINFFDKRVDKVFLRCYNENNSFYWWKSSAFRAARSNTEPRGRIRALSR